MTTETTTIARSTQAGEHRSTIVGGGNYGSLAVHMLWSDDSSQTAFCGRPVGRTFPIDSVSNPIPCKRCQTVAKQAGLI